MLTPMAHRPYPNPDRARRQLDRRKPKPAFASQPTAAEAGQRLAHALRSLPTAREYGISTR